MNSLLAVVLRLFLPLRSMGAPPLVDPQGDYDSYQIALKELKQRRIPIIVRRHLPDGSYEDWKIDDPDLIIL